MLDEKELALYDVCKRMGKFYFFEKFNIDEALATEHVYRLQIQDMKLDGDTLTIVTARPGILIGPRGEDISNLAEYLGVKIHIEESPRSFPDLIQYGIHEETDQYKFDEALDNWYDDRDDDWNKSHDDDLDGCS